MSVYCLGDMVPGGLRKTLEDSQVSLSIAGPREEDFPLVAVNSAFCKMSGYEADEVLGRNCRFLQPEGGAGPVRESIREFLADEGHENARFIIPNQKKDGTRFLNLVYMAKLVGGGQVKMILGSQFAFSPEKTANPDVYDRALQEDLRQMNLLVRLEGMTLLGSFDALASSHSVIAKARME